MAVETVGVEEHRRLAFAIAYRMLGTIAEAEDVVQEALLRVHRAESAGERIEDPRAYVATVATRLAIDHLRSARVRREQYVGVWLPEPLVASADDPAARAEDADSLSTAFLVVLERLSPVERAVFLLRDVFGFDYADIGRIVERREDSVRQIAVRARGHVQRDRARFADEPDRRREIAERFLAAVEEGDLDGLIALLAEDAAAYGDGGGKAAARREPIVGGVEVARFLLGLNRLAQRDGLRVVPAQANGQPALLAVRADGSVVSVMSLHIAGGRVERVFAVVNPDKLARVPTPGGGAGAATEPAS